MDTGPFLFVFISVNHQGAEIKRRAGENLPQKKKPPDKRAVKICFWA
jgi:hypothetical protein